MKERRIDPILEFVKNDRCYDEDWNTDDFENELATLEVLMNSKIHQSLIAFYKEYKVHSSDLSQILDPGHSCAHIRGNRLLSSFVDSGFIPILTYYSEAYGFMDNSSGKVYIFNVMGLSYDAKELDQEDRRGYFLKWHDGEFENLSAYFTQRYHEKTKG